MTWLRWEETRLALPCSAGQSSRRKGDGAFPAMDVGGLRNLPDILSRCPIRTSLLPLQTTLFFCKMGVGTNSHDSYSVKRQAWSTVFVINKTSRWLVIVFFCNIQSIITFYSGWNWGEAALDVFPNHSWSFPPRTVIRILCFSGKI